MPASEVFLLHMHLSNCLEPVGINFETMAAFRKIGIISEGFHKTCSEANIPKK
jgi:hypothetical protein